jgi:damage-control phosphatase, subfamily III
VKRWPIILTQVIDQLYRANHELSLNPDKEAQEKIDEGKLIIQQISRLKHKMSRDHEMEYVHGP